MPQILLPIGITLLCLVVARKLFRPDAFGEATALPATSRRNSPSMYEVVTVSLGLIVAIALLLGGIQIAIAVGLGGLLTLLLNEGVEFAQAIGFIVWGSVNSSTLSALPLFILMAELMLRSGVSDSVLRRHDPADPPHSRRPAADEHRELLAVRGDQRIERRHRRRHRRRRHPAAEGRRLRSRDDRPARSPPAARSAS